MSILPLIAAAAVASHSAGGLPLKAGRFVAIENPCRSAPMSDRSTYPGAGYVIEAPHAWCKAIGVRRRGRGEFDVRQTCRDESMPNSDYAVTDHILVISPTEYTIRNRFGRFHARWCRD